MKLREAENIAQELLSRILPHCERVFIAGSVRRRKSEVKDIEIVALPMRDVIPSLFDGGRGEISKQFATEVHNFGRPVKGSVGGRYMQIAHWSGIMIDLFLPQVHDFFRILAIRTGPAEYSRDVLATRWSMLGWVGTPDGLRRREQCVTVSNGWQCVHPDAERPPVWASEEEFYSWLGLNYVHPEKRGTVKRYVAR